MIEEEIDVIVQTGTMQYRGQCGTIHGNLGQDFKSSVRKKCSKKVLKCFFKRRLKEAYQVSVLGKGSSKEACKVSGFTKRSLKEGN